MRIIAKIIEVGAMNERTFNTQDGTKTIKFCNVHVRQGQDDIIAEATGDKADELTERQLKDPITGLTGFADLEFSKRTSQDGSKVFSNIKFVGFEAM